MAKYLSFVLSFFSSILTSLITVARLIYLLFSTIGSASNYFRKFIEAQGSETSFSGKCDNAERELITELKENKFQILPRYRSRLSTKPKIIKNELTSCSDTIDYKKFSSLMTVKSNEEQVSMVTSTPEEQRSQSSANTHLFSISPMNRRLNMGISSVMQPSKSSSAERVSNIVGDCFMKNTIRNFSSEKNKMYFSSLQNNKKQLRSEERESMSSFQPKSPTSRISKNADKNSNNSCMKFPRNNLSVQEQQSDEKILVPSRHSPPKSQSQSAQKVTNKNQNVSFMQFLRKNRAAHEARAAQEAQISPEARILQLRSGKKISFKPSRPILAKSTSSNALKNNDKKLNNAFLQLPKNNRAVNRVQLSHPKSHHFGNHSRHTVESPQLSPPTIIISAEHNEADISK